MWVWDHLDGEIWRTLEFGVELKCKQVFGDGLSLETRGKEYTTIFVGIGVHKGLKLTIPGADAPNAFTETGL